MTILRRWQRFSGTVVLLILMAAVLSFSVSAATKTIQGTKYTTTYDPDQLGKMFTMVSEIQVCPSFSQLKPGTTLEQADKMCKKTGEVSIADHIKRPVKNSADVLTTKDYGVIAGNIRVDPKESKVMLTKSSRNKAAYYNYYNSDRKLQAQAMFGDSMEIKKVKDERLTNSFYLTITASNSEYYQGLNVLICEKDCKLEMNSKFKNVNVENSAYATTYSTYAKEIMPLRKKYEDKWMEQSKLKEWELFKVSDVKHLYFIWNGKYQLTGSSKGSSGKTPIRFQFWSSKQKYIKSVLSTDIKILNNENLFEFGIIPPTESSTDNPIYLLKSNSEKILLNNFNKGTVIVENTNSNQNAMVKFKIGKSEDFNDYIYYDEAHVKSKIVVINKNLDSECPRLLKDYNCVSVQLLTNTRINIEMPGKDVLSPMTGKKLTGLTSFMDVYQKESTFYFNIEEIKKNEDKIIINKNTKDIDFKRESLNSLKSTGYDLDFSFTAKFPSKAPGRTQDIVKCDHLKKVCYINDVEMSTALGENVCKQEDSSGVKLKFNCYKTAECREFIQGTRSKPIRILFISNGGSYEDFESTLNKYLKDEQFGLLNLEPFKSYANSIGAYSLHLDKPLIATTEGKIFENTELKDAIGKCPGSTHIMLLNPINKGRAHVINNKMFLFKGDDTKVFIHELGHAFGTLDDEYFGKGGLLESAAKFVYSWRVGEKNCILPDKTGSGTQSIAVPGLIILKRTVGAKESVSEKAERNWKKYLPSDQAIALVAKAESGGWWGCGGDCKKFACGDGLRQAKNSIMNSHMTATEWGILNEAILTQKLKAYTGR